jgi:hypothetical protein
MNSELIKTLADEARIKPMGSSWAYRLSDEFEEKFAELIVLECMHDCLRMQLGKQYTPEELLFQTKYRKIIKEHFGVKNEGFWSKE